MYIRLRENTPWNSIKLKNGNVVENQRWIKIDSLEPYDYIAQYLNVRNDFDGDENNKNNYSSLKKNDLLTLCKIELRLSNKDLSGLKKEELIALLQKDEESNENKEELYNNMKKSELVNIIIDKMGCTKSKANKWKKAEIIAFLISMEDE
ncbi:MAG: hypothetical protein PF569_01670 [Candidatus Woesearchaeota archaeon]|jgi:hypothetical protein|nr:hypothetical protein [Candidatus Woesearchaeota archaeon]